MADILLYRADGVVYDATRVVVLGRLLARDPRANTSERRRIIEATRNREAPTVRELYLVGCLTRFG